MSKIVDFHCHILPGVDDGSADVETSLAMLEQEAAQGVRVVVATPHFLPRRDAPERFVNRRTEAAQRLAQAGPESGVELRYGAEVAYFRGMSDSEALEALCIEGTNCILVEMPMESWTAQMFADLSGIRNNLGLTPVIAHVERYLTPWFKRHGLPRLREMPVLLQANAGFFLQKATAKTALRMLEEGIIHLLGSDCHNTTSRPPNLGNAVAVIEERLGEAALAAINRNEAWVLGDCN